MTKFKYEKDLFDLQDNYQTEPGERQTDLEMIIEEKESLTTTEKNNAERYTTGRKNNY